MYGKKQFLCTQGRTDQQCMGRWRRHLDPAINRAPWRGAEDAALAMQVHRHGSQWSRISRAFAGRTAQQCRARCGPPPPPAALLPAHLMLQ